MKRRSVVGENIRRLRIKAGITQEELALRSDLSQGYINHLEMGKRNYTQKSLELIADALSLPIIEFFKPTEIEAPLEEVQEKPLVYKDPKTVRRELLSVIKRLPLPVADHYLTLMKIESDLLFGGRRPNR